MIFDIIAEMGAEFNALFHSYGGDDMAVYGAALLVLGLCFRLFWHLSLPVKTKK